MRHLVLEAVAHAADEAEAKGEGRCTVTLHADGSVSVADDGRGTDTRFDAHGRPVKKPVVATKDLRFFDHPDAQLLPDGHPRRGMSVVAALTEWLVFRPTSPCARQSSRRPPSSLRRHEHRPDIDRQGPVHLIGGDLLKWSDLAAAMGIGEPGKERVTGHHRARLGFLLR